MIALLAGGRGAVMAADAGPQHFSVVHGKYWFPGIRAMAGFAQIRSGHVIARLAGGKETVVAGQAGLSRNTTVVKGDVPLIGIVAGITGFAGNDVSRSFTGGDHAIMTNSTGAQCLCVLEAGHGQPGRHVVAGVADPGSGHMVRRIIRVVTGFAGANDMIVIHFSHRGKASGIVAGPANIAGINVIRCLAGGDSAVMATLTNSDDLGVIHRIRWQPGGCQVTGFTNIRTVNVASRFAGGSDTIVAAYAGAQQIVVIIAAGDPDRCCVTGIAEIRAQQVVG